MSKKDAYTGLRFAALVLEDFREDTESFSPTSRLMYVQAHDWLVATLVRMQSEMDGDAE